MTREDALGLAALAGDMASAAEVYGRQAMSFGAQSQQSERARERVHEKRVALIQELVRLMPEEEKADA